ncbi:MULTISPECIES: extracellular solute-binding protein [Cohnella]|uniref:Putative aldouronate transport system substrate-binding protein n=1 Tax=Cohnella phaseoli TaxID=456490 RepID=A0A3D9KTC1_9BACL|nr:extracellular solute-binding protein [Cohnella phaseoli]RED89258.1 putative aldouronate transport system substrate-binding protein [Cohnella phaseoli]
MSFTMKKGLALSCAAALLLASAACSSAKNNAQTEGSASPQATATTSSQPSDSAAATGKYDPPITLTTVRANDTALFTEGQTMDKNAIYDAYEQDLGITLKNNWVVDTKEYDSKLKISIAANDLPDFFKVSAEDLPRLVESDMVMDLTEVFEQYASEETKKLVVSDGGKQMQSATFDGKLMAIPQTNSPFNAASFVWVRQDWLQEMNLPEPKTMQDLLQISEAFASRNTGGKGKAFGLGLDKDQIGSPIGFLNGYHAYPGQWVKDSSGKLVYGSTQPEVKTALKQLQDMYKAGQIDPEVAVNDNAKMLEQVSNDRVGMLFGAFWYSAAMQDAVVKDGKVTQEWGVYTIPSVDGDPAMSQVSASVASYYVVNKNAEHPEAVMKVLNQWVDALLGGKPADGDPRAVYSFGKELKDMGNEAWAINPLTIFIQDLYVQGGQHLGKALDTGDTSAIEWSGDLKNRYDQVKKFEAGDTTFWYQVDIAGKGGAFEKMYEYSQQNRYHFDEFYGVATPTMAERGDLLKTKEQEVFTKIIIGAASIDEFDKFVADWTKLGGDKITEEVNEWHASRQ